ncbi:MAG: ParB/RepB/Spo0J family partition protein [Gemmatimonadetes bacterium]|nr:ParB/RepB/Spo0J family partition protein [Gemmatimonadota bacterium]
MAKRNALGKGLGALIPGADTAPAEKITSEIAPSPTGQTQRQIIEISIDDIEPNPHQPRTEFDPKAVGELAQSIREKGIIQPVSVRRFGSGYQLIAGERRFRAARQAELTVVPAIVMDVGTDQEMMELSLIENIQRENLNPIEEAKAYRMLIEECFLTQEEVAEHVGKNRSTIANTLRLLALAPEALDALQAGQISAGHARALLGLDNADQQIALCQRIIAQELSVRRTEALVKALKEDTAPKKTTPPKDPNLLFLEEDLQRYFGTAVNISRRGSKGKIEIEFYSNDDLERVLELLRSREF